MRKWICFQPFKLQALSESGREDTLPSFAYTASIVAEKTK